MEKKKENTWDEWTIVAHMPKGDGGPVKPLNIQVHTFEKRSKSETALSLDFSCRDKAVTTPHKEMITSHLNKI